MTARRCLLAATLPLLLASCGGAGVTDDPFQQPIEATEGVIVVGFEELATLPEVNGAPARPMLLVDEPATGRMFLADMWGPLYTVGYDGTVRQYLDVNEHLPVEAGGREVGFQSFALHPQFAEEGAPGYGRLYTWSDTPDRDPEPDYAPPGGQDTHDTVLLEWVASDASAPVYDGGPPRELLRIEQPFRNHNAGHLAFNPTAAPGEPDFGMLYVGVADGGSGGDPMDLAQDAGSIFGKILRIDPLGSDGPNGRYGIPADNPFLGREGALGELFAIGLRNPQRFAWDPASGAMYVADIGQNTIEELSPVTPGANLGWNVWEGSFRFVDGDGVNTGDPRSDPAMTYPVAEYDQDDPLFGDRAAVTGVVVVRSDRVPSLQGRILFGDLATGEIFHVSADDPPDGGQDRIRRVLLRDTSGEPRTFLEVVNAAREAQGRAGSDRTDLRLNEGPDGRIFLTNKHDGIVRELVP